MSRWSEGDAVKPDVRTNEIFNIKQLISLILNKLSQTALE